MATLEAGTTHGTRFQGAWRTEGPADRVTWYLRSPKHYPKHQETPAVEQTAKATSIPG